MSEPTIVSGKNYVAICPSLGAWGVVTDVKVTKSWRTFEESTDANGDIDGHILAGLKQEVSATYKYLTGASAPPETVHASGGFLVLTDLSTGGQLPGKILLSEVEHQFTAGQQATATIQGVYAPYMDALT